MTDFKIRSFFERITMYIYRIRARHTGGVGGWQDVHSCSCQSQKKTSVSVLDRHDCFNATGSAPTQADHSAGLARSALALRPVRPVDLPTTSPSPLSDAV